MKVARVNGRTIAIADSAFGLGGATAQPAVGDLSDVDLTGLADGDTLVFDVGSGTWIPGTGSASVDLPWWNVKTDGTCVGDGVTDDTVALQASIDDATANGTQSANIYFPPGTYLIGGALQDTGAFNAQVLFPSVSSSDEQIFVRLVGSARPPMEGVGPLPTPNGYSIIKSTLTGGSGTAAVFSGGNQVFSSLNNIQVYLKDLLCIAPDNPSLTFWNLSATQGGGIHDVEVATEAFTGTVTQPTHSNSYGFRVSARGQSNYTYVDGMVAAGHYTGAQLTELATVRGLVVYACIYGVELQGSPYPVTIVSMVQVACTYGIRPVAGTGGALGAVVYCDILSYVAERLTSPSWEVTVADLYDPSDLMSGHIRYVIHFAVTGALDSFIASGAANASYVQTGALVAAPAFATPAIVLGTAAAAGAAATVIRSDSTIVAFDATAPVTQAFGDAAATGSAAVAARRDHRHGMPSSGSGGVGAILISDTHSTPLVFDDLLQNDDGDDLLYADI